MDGRDFTREQKVAALQVAKRRIENESDDYVCVALPDTRVGKYLRKYIENQISPFLYFDEWYLAKFNKEPSLEEFRKIRIQWINWMIDNAT